MSALKKYLLPIGIQHEIHWNSMILNPPTTNTWIWIFKIYQSPRRSSASETVVLAFSVAFSLVASPPETKGDTASGITKETLDGQKWLVAWLVGVCVFFSWSSLQKCTKTNKERTFSQNQMYIQTWHIRQANTFFPNKRTWLSQRDCKELCFEVTSLNKRRHIYFGSHVFSCKKNKTFDEISKTIPIYCHCYLVGGRSKIMWTKNQ